MRAVDFEHWRHQPLFAEIEYRWIGEASTKLAGLSTGEIHMTQLPQDLKEQAVAAGAGLARPKVFARERALFVNNHVFDKNYFSYEAQGTPCGFVHCDSVFNDVKVRRAMSKAVNRDEINAVYYGGEGTEVHNPHLIPTASYWNPAWDQNFEAEYGYDPAMARQLLADAGYGPNNPLEVLIDGVPSGGLPEKADQAETILGYFRDVGIAAELDQRDAAATRAISRVFGHTNRMTFMGSNIYETQAFRVHHHSGTTPRGGPEFRGPGRSDHPATVHGGPGEGAGWSAAGGRRFLPAPHCPPALLGAGRHHIQPGHRGVLRALGSALGGVPQHPADHPRL